MTGLGVPLLQVPSGRCCYDVAIAFGVSDVGGSGEDVCSDKGPEGMCVSGVMAEEVGGICQRAPASASLFQYEDISEIPWFMY
jgi:hypothetical protein